MESSFSVHHQGIRSELYCLGGGAGATRAGVGRPEAEVEPGLRGVGGRDELACEGDVGS
jgi:hypothetical protein